VLDLMLLWVSSVSWGGFVFSMSLVGLVFFIHEVVSILPELRQSQSLQ
jgi:hypothetical protein